MRSLVFTKRTRLQFPAIDLFRFHSEPDALTHLTPEEERVSVVSTTHDGLVEGCRVTLRLGGFPGGSWISEITDVCPGRGFRDVMVKGPFARWEHRHRFLPAGPDASILEDRIEYALPLGFVGRLLGGRLVRRRLERLFAWRHARTAEILAERRERRSRSGLVLLAHGSRDPSWRRTFDGLCRDIGGEESGRTVRLAFLQFDRPTLAEAIRECAAEGASLIRVLPLFLATGGHVGRDIPEQLDAFHADDPDVEVELLPALGEHPNVLSALADTARGLGWAS